MQSILLKLSSEFSFISNRWCSCIIYMYSINTPISSAVLLSGHAHLSKPSVHISTSKMTDFKKYSQKYKHPVRKDVIWVVVISYFHPCPLPQEHWRGYWLQLQYLRLYCIHTTTLRRAVGNTVSRGSSHDTEEITVQYSRAQRTLLIDNQFRSAPTDGSKSLRDASSHYWSLPQLKSGAQIENANFWRRQTRKY